jgi:uncharacterized protein (DUF433 family)
MVTPKAPEITSRIVCDPRILGGEPTVAGTRTSVRSIVLAAREQGSVSGVLQWYPHLSERDVAEALTYFLKHGKEVEEYIDGNRDE